jgi:hypothetical protein
VADELAIINSPIDNDDLVIHTMNGLGSEYKEVAASIRTREKSLSFEELHDLLTDFESYLHRDEATENPSPVVTANAAQKAKMTYPKRGQHSGESNNSFANQRSVYPNSSKRVICQFCEKPGHTAKICYRLHGYPPKNKPALAAHHARNTSSNIGNSWIMDSGATHHLTRDLENLHLTSPYQGSDQIVVGDGNALPITHIGKTTFKTPSCTLHLPQVFRVPSITQNLLSVSSLCNTNPISVEFFSDCFLVKDLKTKVPLLRGQHKNGLYCLPSSPPSHTALHSTSQPSPPWHHILGHPSKRIQRHLTSQFQIKQSPIFPCVSCESSKSHKLPFSKSSLKSSKPLELIYTDVWGPAPTRSLDDFSYYLVFVDHFSKYVWLYPLKNKSDVSFIFPKFKSVVEKFFNLPIVSLYSDNGGEFIKLKSFLSQNGISHFTTPPHTPELNATAERRHRHIVETGRTLLHHANLPHKFWSFAFTTAAYLINRLPTPILHMQSPYEVLHKTKPNILHLHSFGCLCFPWLKPYTKNKLQPRSTPCIFIGYSSSQYAYHCLDPITEKIYTSRHVSFFDHQFPYKTIISKPAPSDTFNPKPYIKKLHQTHHNLTK